MTDCLLNEFLANGTLTISDIRSLTEEGLMKRIISKVHKYSITAPKKAGDRWSTYVLEKGKRKKVTRNNEKDLEEFLLEFYSKELNESFTVKEVYEHYRISRREQMMSGNITSQTYYYDESTWDRFLKDRTDFINMQINEVKPIHLERLSKVITGDGTVYTKKAFNKLKALINGIFDEAVMMGVLDCSFSKDCLKRIACICKFKKDNAEDGQETEKDVYTREEIEILRAYLRTLPQTTYTLAVEFASYFFMRIGELRALTWDDYKKDTQELFIWHEITQEERNGKKRCDVDTPHTKSGKEAGRRYVPVPERAVDILEKMYTINGDRKYIFNGEKNAKFAISENKFNQHLKAYCEACGVKYRSSHKFRFFGISECYRNGVDEHRISKLAGHTTVEMTRHYDRSKEKRDNSDVRDIMS